VLKDSDFRWYTPASRQFMGGDYLLPGEGLGERVWAIVDWAAHRLGANCPKGFRELVAHGLQMGWSTLSTPMWTNFGTDRGLPASCSNSMARDSMDDLMGDLHGELSMMSKNGGGTSVCMSDVRGRGMPIREGRNGTTLGSVHFATHYQSLIKTASQGSTRRGSIAAYWSVRHPDIREVLDIKTNGHPIQDKAFHFGVTFDDPWMEEMVGGDAAKRAIWARVLECRREHGEPYVLFEGAMNRGMPLWYKNAGLSIRASNLCTEVTPTSNWLESFVCILLSLNVRYYDEWKNTDFPQMLVYLLDAAVEDFLEKARDIPYMHRAVRYVERHRSIGIGQLGWHDYLQSKGLAFDEPEAYRLNAEIARLIQAKTVEASERMAREYGEPEVTRGYGRRHALLQAIAPTQSSALILDITSESVSPREANVVVKDRAKGKFEVWNPYLLKLLGEKGMDTPTVRKQILLAGGSVQGLDGLTDREKLVFRTAFEIPQLAIVQQAAQRQQFIDQAQSISLFVHPQTPPKQVNAIHLEAWKLGLKTLYYQHNENEAKTFARDLMSCTACEA
jgi:ribonucleoside-diphosphate reductase alpha chain